MNAMVANSQPSARRKHAKSEGRYGTHFRPGCDAEELRKALAQGWQSWPSICRALRLTHNPATTLARLRQRGRDTNYEVERAPTRGRIKRVRIIQLYP